jgi:hypothetical protein
VQSFFEFTGTYYFYKRFSLTRKLSAAGVSPQLALTMEVVMSKLRLASVAIAAWASATVAQALKAQMNASERETGTQTFNCRPVETGQNRIVAADPPRTVIVSLILTSNKASAFKVSYIEDNKEKSDPADKTKPWLLVTMPSGHDYHWYAAGRRQPNLLMHGRLFEQSGARDGEKRWLYREEQFEAGVKTADFQIACAKE